jgi:hypothetical protein
MSGFPAMAGIASRFHLLGMPSIRTLKPCAIHGAHTFLTVQAVMPKSFVESHYNLETRSSEVCYTNVTPIAFFNLLTDAADIPASRAACRTPLPAANATLALSTLALAIGGRPNLMDKPRAVA